MEYYLFFEIQATATCTLMMLRKYIFDEAWALAFA